MRHHRAVWLCVTGLCLMGGCSTDATKSSTDTPSTSPIAQAQEGTDQPPSGEVQERAVPGMPVPRMMPGLGTAPAPGPPPRQMAPKVPAPPMVAGPPLSALPGEFALETWVGSGVVNSGVEVPIYGPGTPHYVSAVAGGGICCYALHTDARQVGSWERFKLLVVGNGQYAIQTVRNYYLGAAGGGAGGGDTSQFVISTVETNFDSSQTWQKFRLLQQPDSGTYAIQTGNATNYVTAVGGGGKTTDAIHTDAAKVGAWEQWRLVKSGDLGSGYCYGIQAFTGFFLSAPGGGGRTTDAILHVSPAMGPLHSPERFRLMRQADGSYALQTANGSNYLTAVNGGGLVQSSATWNILQTDRTQVQAWEKFRFVDQGDGTYAIQTVSGYYLGLYPTAGVYAFITDRSIIGPGEKFKLIWCDPLSPTTGGPNAGPKGGVGGVMPPPATTNAPPPVYVGPTDNLTKVANAIQVLHKSLTILVTVAPGLALTQPVTISIAGGGYGPTRLTQTYVPTGNHFLFNDPEGNGKPRSALVDITLTEPKPGGGVYSYAIPGNVMLDPLYDVTIGSLQFSLTNSCALFGDSQIRFEWLSPDGKSHSTNFSIGDDNHWTANIPQFAWAQPEVSASAHLHQPVSQFFDTDEFTTGRPTGAYLSPTLQDLPTVNLVPIDTSHLIPSSISSANGVTTGSFAAARVPEASRVECAAGMVYRITYTLRWYLSL